MISVTNVNFGPLIACLIPGATALYGVGSYVPMVRSWFPLASAKAAGKANDGRKR